MIEGYIHSIESMGLVDGPGIRTVVFFQGCRLRCRYCHNPDTWKHDENTVEYTADELLNKALAYRPYWKNKGGRSEEHTSELQSHHNLVCRLLLEKNKSNI